MAKKIRHSADEPSLFDVPPSDGESADPSKDDGLEAPLDAFLDASFRSAAAEAAARPASEEDAEPAASETKSADLAGSRAFDVLTAPLGVPTLLEASAGTGKTFSIKHLVLRLVVEEGIPIERLLVVTFTRAAAAELRERIQRALSDAEACLTGIADAADLDGMLVKQAELWAEKAREAEAEGDEETAAWYAKPAAAKRLRASLANFDNAAIFTIHGFAQKMLQSHAFSSGSALDCTLAVDDAEMLEEAVEDFMRRELDRAATDEERRLVADVFSTGISGWVAKLEKLCALPPDLVGRVVKIGEESKAGKKRPAKNLSAEEIEALKREEDGRKAEAERRGEFARGLLERFVEEAPLIAAEKKRRAGILTFSDLLSSFWRRLAEDEDGRFRSAIRSSFQGVLIDEFQDTDPLQFAIFRTLFIDGLIGEKTAAEADVPEGAAPKRPRRAFFLVGDPKQAIYRFRSADLDTYLSARKLMREIGAEKELSTNFRSTPKLVDACNAFFSTAEDFARCAEEGGAKADGEKPGGASSRKDGSKPPKAACSDEMPTGSAFLRSDLAYAGVRSSPAKTGLFELGADNAWREAPAFEIWGSFSSMPFETAEEMHASSCRALAADIAGWLGKAREGRAGVARDEDDEAPVIGEAEVDGKAVALRALEARDIAILARSRSKVPRIRKALLDVGVRVMHASNENVTETEEAYELFLILRAFNSPGDERAVRAALATRLMGEPLSTIAAEDEAERIELRRLFEDCAKIWRRAGVAAAFERLCRARDVAGRLLKVKNGERILTNYSHLIEILHEAGRSRPTTAGLAAWFEAVLGGRMIKSVGAIDAEDASDACRLRLESDANVVSLVTIHSSKGLQYPLVYLPFGESMCGSERKGSVFRTHPDGPFGGMTLQLSDKDVEPPPSLQHEAQEEEVRLAYVALTRAAKRVVVSLPQLRKSEKNPDKWCGRLLKNACFQVLTGMRVPSQEGVMAAIDILKKSRASVLVRELADVAGAPVKRLDAGGDAEALSAAPAKPRRSAWRLSSFTAISRMLDEPPGAARPQFGRRLSDAEKSGILRFPKGAQAGACLHRILELADFAYMADDAPPARAARRKLCRAVVGRSLSFGSEEDEEAAVQGAAQMIYDVLNAEIAPGICLRNVPASARAAEFEFLLHLPSTTTAEVLGTALGELDPRYGIEGLGSEALKGFLSGFIDLTIAAGGRFWVIDWKSNAIAGTAEGFTSEAMAAEMTKHRYRLQYLIYLAALRRFLRVRMGPAFREDMIGGAIYVFLRGVRAGATTAENPQGIVFDPVHPAVVRGLDELFEKGFSPRRFAELRREIDADKGRR